MTIKILIVLSSLTLIAYLLFYKNLLAKHLPNEAYFASGKSSSSLKYRNNASNNCTNISYY